MLTIRSPLMYIPEREYILKVIFQEFLGIQYNILFEDTAEFEITLEGCNNNAKLVIADIFLQTDELFWLTKATLPKSPLESLEHPLYGPLPIIFGKRNSNGSYYDNYPQSIYCGIDIFGSAFFMLTRYEEYVITERDQRNRFSARSSLAFREKFLNRPIINEYVEILWESISALWPQIQRLPRKQKFILSHDVDWPFYVVGKTNSQIIKEAMSDAVKRRDLQSAYIKAKAIWSTRNGDLTKDPFNTFRWIMDQSEKAGIRSAFYFITQETLRGLDGNYSMYDREIQHLLCEINARGHEIGLHPSYNTYSSPQRLKQQFEILLDVTQANRIFQDEWGGRQHYLRWSASETWQHWEDAGLSYDSTLSYADFPGFRCGVCYEYPVFNLLTRRSLKLKERPLIVMEQTVLHMQYLGLKGQEALKVISNFHNQCKRFNGDFTLLWHNSQLVKYDELSLYQECVSLLKTN
ncbi:polysaccharide deacetylase family protein [Paenibacillus qinlingensis]|uniref:Peptidoglycan/xylan/chitin deacetylase (PgdA/CDA1 family) n=1 Tax=Paenibacillus qinlingensis TaxID=1837343 RepID=A0ABU1P299_9BACL|nr:polysaccharide deacetylase family protein [Paenibacillus qinlingensis]MDR6553878.1 peptidoglycan/xylan/chitin deacetylase (PgdA/CDA1 family) [Paenibacillus qinlingensis]